MKISRMEGFIRWYHLFGEGMETWCLLCHADILLIMLSKQPHQIPFTANSSSLAPFLFMYTGQGQLIGGSITTQSAPTYPQYTPHSTLLARGELEQLSAWCMTLYKVLCSVPKSWSPATPPPKSARISCPQCSLHSAHHEATRKTKQLEHMQCGTHSCSSLMYQLILIISIQLFLVAYLSDWLLLVWPCKELFRHPIHSPNDS